MSGFAGLWRLDGAPAAPFLPRQLGALGSHAAQAKTCTSHALALGGLPLFPVSSQLLIVTGSEGKRLVVVADARLDNRSELAEEMALEPGVSAAAVILAAYQRWGEKCPAHLLGDFAFAVWDEAAEVLLLARDPFGIRPLFYHYAPGRLFAFANRMQAIRVLPEVSDQINPAQVAGFLTADLADTDATFYVQVRRLAPGHAMRVANTGMRSWAYWTLDPERQAPTASFAEYVEGFRYHYLRAVERRLETPEAIGALVSGGLDSSGIAAAARQMIPSERLPELPTYSIVFETVRASDEREYIDAVLAEGGFRNRKIVGDAISPLADLTTVFAAHDEPVHAPNLFLHRAMWSAARDEGCRIVLDGLDGDTTVSHGYGGLGNLAQQGHFPAFFREAWRVTGRARGSFPRTVYRHLLAPIRARLQPGRIRPLAPQVALLRPELQALLPKEASLHPGERMRRCPGTREHYRKLRSGMLAHFFELATIDAAQLSIEPRFPFCDQDLVEYCLSLPPEAKLRDGWSRAVMREALQGILPDAVRLRGGKANLGFAFRRGLLHFEREALMELLARGREPLAEFLDIPSLEQAVQRYLGGEQGLAMLIWRPLILARWLEWRGRSEKFS